MQGASLSLQHLRGQERAPMSFFMKQRSGQRSGQCVVRCPELIRIVVECIVTKYDTILLLKITKKSRNPLVKYKKVEKRKVADSEGRA